MAEGGDIKVQVGILGDKEYTRSLSDMNRQLALLNSEMKASQSEFGSLDTSLAGLRDKHEKLSALYDAQADKVHMLSDQLSEAEKEFGKNSMQAEKLRIELDCVDTRHVI